jgi:hypothetical protein
VSTIRRPAVRNERSTNSNHDHHVAVRAMASGELRGRGDKLVPELPRRLVGASPPTSPTLVCGAGYAGRPWVGSEATVEVSAKASDLVLNQRKCTKGLLHEQAV